MSGLSYGAVKWKQFPLNTCYLKVRNGGINLVNLKLKCQALRVAGMISTLNNLFDFSFYLCRFYVGRRLSTLRTEWRSLASNLIPNAVLPSNFYSDCISVLRSVRLSDDNLNSKVFYNLLLSKESSSPLLSWHWTPVLGPGFSLSGHWSLVNDQTYSVFFFVCFNGKVTARNAIISSISHLMEEMEQSSIGGGQVS